MKKKQLYPGVKEAEEERKRAALRNAIENEEPDFIAGAPNYDKYAGWPAEKVLAWLNID